ncbi:hypothetical protein SISNIDRAFT_468451 [Sistotremastrum niveocremeum HHB9708]|uniref:Uncharacterized protein n=1 Tax=Sistotremastrum niveocremeum HHB9708 TaxID=1314777 RepID=A0A164RMA7_9AGAM|nr:hypothetical protein SISNIDRAFT_468451 [Sistotremastrum niveocremeum HHB9708]
MSELPEALGDLLIYPESGTKVCSQKLAEIGHFRAARSTPRRTYPPAASVFGLQAGGNTWLKKTYPGTSEHSIDPRADLGGTERAKIVARRPAKEKRWKKKLIPSSRILTLIAGVGGRGNENDERDEQGDERLDGELSLKKSRLRGAAGSGVLLAARKWPISANFCEQTLVPQKVSAATVAVKTTDFAVNESKRISEQSSPQALSPKCNSPLGKYPALGNLTSARLVICFGQLGDLFRKDFGQINHCNRPQSAISPPASFHNRKFSSRLARPLLRYPIPSMKMMPGPKTERWAGRPPVLVLRDVVLGEAPSVWHCYFLRYGPHWMYCDYLNHHTLIRNPWVGLIDIYLPTHNLQDKNSSTSTSADDILKKSMRDTSFVCHWREVYEAPGFCPRSPQ